MNILLDGTVFEIPKSGIARTILELYGAAAKLNPALQVSVLHRRDLCVELPAMWRQMRWCSRLPLAAWRQLAFHVAKFVLRPDWIHFPWNGGLPLLPLSGRVVVTLHDVLPLEIPGFFTSVNALRRYRNERARDLRRAHLVVTDSEYSRHRICEEFQGGHDPKVLLLGSLDKLPRKTAPLPVPYFIYVGGYDPRKGLSLLVRRHIKLWNAARLCSPLVLTGYPVYHDPDFYRLVKEGIAAGHLIECGQLTDEDLATWLSHARALLYPSCFEGFGLPPLEAMSLGCPVLTTPFTSLPEICGDAVLYANPSDEQAWNTAWCRLENDAILRRDLSEKGRQRAGLFSWKSSAEKLLQLLDEGKGTE